MVALGNVSTCGKEHMDRQRAVGDICPRAQKRIASQSLKDTDLSSIKSNSFDVGCEEGASFSIAILSETTIDWNGGQLIWDERRGVINWYLQY
ncbi:hypothetical protein M408DRAFT_269803 [Serendipita vermifera MAFF 305830]|uniref:Uncharacterized protein n=1 Tax=Serendipita vermifera MAFF 305830 TaxID=933852 RepID=A0A0C2WXA9_SERVB|nr:hypothetical protein M408DRAFT_269803 [Serendipita vermifera MAFF 305830]